MIGALFAKLLARRSFDAINKRDVDSLLASWHEDAVLTYSGKLSVSGTREGKQAIRTWFQHFKERVPTRTFRPRAVCVENIFDVFGTNVVAIVWEDRPINKNGKEFWALRCLEFDGARSWRRQSTYWSKTCYPKSGVRTQPEAACTIC